MEQFEYNNSVEHLCRDSQRDACKPAALKRFALARRRPAYRVGVYVPIQSHVGIIHFK